MKTTHRTLRCSLTEEELDQKHDQLAVEVSRNRDLDKKLNEMKSRQQSEKKALESLIKESVGSQRHLATDIETRSEERPVECSVLYDFSGNRVAIRREDTGAIVEVRTMLDGERQMAIAEEVKELPKDVVVDISRFLQKQAEKDDDTPAPEPER